MHKDKALLSLQYKSFFKVMSKLKRGVALIAELFENTERVIISRKLKRDRLYNGQKKKAKRANNDLQTLLRKLNIEYHEPH